MVNKTITNATLEDVKSWGEGEYFSEGLVLANCIGDAPILQEATRMNFILMALCLKGKAQYTIDTREQTVAPGDLLFISERHIVDNYKATPDFECLGIMLSTEYYHSFIMNVKNVSALLLFSMNNPVVPLTAREREVYKTYFQVIREKMADNSHHYRKELVKALLLAMFYDMSNVIYRVEHKGAKVQTRADVIFSQFIQLLEKNFREQHRVSWYAEQMCITPKYLSQIIGQVSNNTPAEWIDKYVLLELRVLLRNSEMSIKEITDYMNFPNQSFLGKYFKEHMGMSPKEYRKG